MIPVSGQKDPIIVLLRELQNSEGRRKHRRFFAEEVEIVRRAFDFGAKVEAVIVTEKLADTPETTALLEAAATNNTPIYAATSGLIGKVLDAKPTPDCIAIIERKTASLDEVAAAPDALIQVVESCENADNLGMLLRSTEAAGVTSVVLTGDTADPFARKVVRGSRGAVFNVPLCIEPDIKKVAQALKSGGIQLVATSARAENAYTDVDYTKPCAVTVGNEHTGISDELREAADVVVRIPMLGRINSLNIAVAASIMLYEVVRQRS
jgi:RNA methyltransferase, TrmH family